MKTIFKKFDIAGLAVLLLAFFVAVGFTATNTMQPTWYEVEIIDEDGDHDNPENQAIGAPLGQTPPTGDCSSLMDELLCAIELTLGDTPLPQTVAEADTTDGVTIGARRFKELEIK